MPRVVATNPHFEGDRSTLSLRTEQLHGWLAEPEHDLSCRSFRVHLEIIHKLRNSQLGTSVVVVNAGPDEATLWPSGWPVKTLQPTRSQRVCVHCDARQLSTCEVPTTLAPTTKEGSQDTQAHCTL